MEIHDIDVLVRRLEAGEPLAGVRLQDLDLGPVESALFSRHDVEGLVVLGGTMSAALATHLQGEGAVVLPALPGAPVDVFRAHLYSGPDLYAGLEAGYDATCDARAYAWARDSRLTHDAYATLLRAIHDDSVTDALDEWVAGRAVVGVMGGHAADRGSVAYAVAARLGRGLAEAGLLVATGGGPGAMEAANLGAVAPSDAALDEALDRLRPVPTFRPDPGAWVRTAFAVLASFAEAGRGSVEPRHGVREPVARPGALEPSPRARSLGVPTWFYGHEPPNVFAEGIAKYFSNAIREDGLLARCTAGVVVLPGAAGTVQEVFQLATRLYYADATVALPPLVLVGKDYWTTTLPVLPLLEGLGRERAMAAAVHVVETPDEAVALLAP